MLDSLFGDKIEIFKTWLEITIHLSLDKILLMKKSNP